MGVISRYLERWVAIARLGRGTPAAAAPVVAPPGVSGDAAGLRVGAVTLPWNEVQRLEAFKRDVYVGDVLCLAVLGAGGQVLEISEASPGWQEAGAAIERFLPGSLPQARWMLALIAAPPGQSVAVFPAG